MSLFQCARCGCVENTACSSMGHCLMNYEWEHDPKDRPALQSYKAILGLADDEPFPRLCSACSPVWFDNGNYGIGPNPNPTPGKGLWHGEFPREYLPLGEYMTNPHTGDLVRKDEYAEPAPVVYRATSPTFEITRRPAYYGDNPFFTEGQNRAARRRAKHNRRK